MHVHPTERVHLKRSINIRQKQSIGFSNKVVQTSGTSATWNVPAACQVTGGKFKVVIVGGGGQGGGTSTTAGQTGGGGGSGGKAVNLNGKTVTWTGGPSSTSRVYGAIS